MRMTTTTIGIQILLAFVCLFFMFEAFFIPDLQSSVFSKEKKSINYLQTPHFSLFTAHFSLFHFRRNDPLTLFQSASDLRRCNGLQSNNHVALFRLTLGFEHVY